LRIWVLLVWSILLPGAQWPAAAMACPMPDAFAIQAGSLPATKAAVAKRQLTIMALGGAATIGTAAHGAEFNYPSRLAARLGRALPAVTIKMVIRASPRQPEADFQRMLDTNLAGDKPALVIWGPGASAAGRGDDLDTFVGDVSAAIEKIRLAGADLILMTLQYAPSVARVVNLPPYRMAVMRAAETANTPVLDRYEMMRFWSDNGFLDLDVSDGQDRVRVARKLYDCMGEILAEGIVDALK
jgi:hypothetical protein